VGNTNLPQFGAADTANSHDTREGEQQLTPAQINQRDDQARGGLNSLLPDSVANESQRAVVHADHGKNEIGQPAAEVTAGSAPAGTLSANLEIAAADHAALAGHVGTGHSPSDAT
jgi:hypothetical protein